MEQGLTKSNNKQTNSLSVTPKGGVITLLKERRFDEIVKAVPNSVEKIMDARLICDLVREVGKETIQQMLETEIIKLANQINVAHNINATQLPFIAETLLNTYPTESLADFILVFKRGAIGFYGNTYHKLDCATIMEWMAKHIEEKSMYRERDNSNSKKNEEHTAIDYEEYKSRLEASRLKEREQKINKIVHEDGYEQFKEEVKTAKDASDSYLLIKEKKLAAAKSRGLDKLNLGELKTFDVEDQRIVARTLEEAREIFIEVYEA
ncbi:MAG: hypothetical protein IM602_17300 [Cytophagales bacterium]|jgi:hypothetical protein|nr:hypothetical protein [Cytophagales bacterium]MCA6415655.1 hypothetical protein [Cytophagales bacterium]MCA6427403.1 hypothetical protein [Cytophagales bacterium]